LNGTLRGAVFFVRGKVSHRLTNAWGRA
jgi:hypothetical protein